MVESWPRMTKKKKTFYLFVQNKSTLYINIMNIGPKMLPHILLPE